MTEEKFKQIKEKVKKGLYIARIPSKEKAYFIDLANSDFEGDYGMLLKFYNDIHRGWIPQEDSQINAKFDLLAVEITQNKKDIEQLKQEEEKDKKPEGKKMLSGKILKKPEQEE